MMYKSESRKKKARLTKRGKALIVGLILITLLIGVIIVVATGISSNGDMPSLTNKSHEEKESVALSDTGKDNSEQNPDTNDESGETAAEETGEDELVTVEPAKRISDPYMKDNGCWYVDVDDTSIILANRNYALPESYGGEDAEANAALGRMIEGARTDGCNLVLYSGYRSYGTQAAIHARYTAEQGEEAADRISAEAGHSEHQTGLAFDILSDTYSRMNSGFGETEEAQWMAEHCWEYGFILRYLEDKEDETGYMYEPWHFRYIGNVDLAKEITESGKSLEDFLGIL